MTTEHAYVGVGLYSVPEAARLTGVSSSRIRRWVKGYSFNVGDKVFSSPKVWTPDLEPIGDTVALSFRDLIEVRFVDYFLRKGVSWPTLRRAAGHAADIVGSSHPFATKRFRTDGRSIITEIKSHLGNRYFLDAKDYQVQLFEPELFAGLEFDRLSLVRWYPMDPNRRVVVDPTVAFGRPTLAKEGIPTGTIYSAFEAERSTAAVARWFEVSEKSVEAAVEFEQKLAA